MPESELNLDGSHRDGTSQAERPLLALDPGYVSVEERSIADWLRFVRAYGERLVFYNSHNKPDGVWNALFNLSDAELEGFASYLENPGAEDEPRFRRPHFVLFLAFLEALRPVNDRLNRFTRRHLEHYYRDVLGFAPKEAVPDRVHILVEPAPRHPEFLLAGGTRLKAGADAAGEDLTYETENDLVVNAAKVASLKSLFLQRKHVGLEEVRRNPEVLVGILPRSEGWIHLPPDDKRFLAMLELALRDPAAGRPLPRYERPKLPDLELTPALLREFDGLLSVVVDQLFLPLPVFASVMTLKRQLDPALEPAAGVWARINETLRQVGALRTKDPNFKLPARPVDDFLGNLDAALALPANAYDGLPEVSDIFGVYRHLDDEDALEVREFVRNRLFMSLEAFRSMMSAVEGFHQNWRRLNDVLRSAGRRKQRRFANHKVVPVGSLRTFDPARWDVLVARNLGKFSQATVGNRVVATLDDMFDEMRWMTDCLRMSPEEYRTARRVGASAESKPWEWDEVYAIFRAASETNALDVRKRALRRVLENATNRRDGIEAMARLALGEPGPEDPLPGGRGLLDLSPEGDADRLKSELFLTPANLRFIQELVVPGASPTPADWEAAVAMLEQAQRRKRGSEAVPLELEAWENVYAADDATRVQSASGMGEEGSPGRWRVFGEGARTDGATRPGQVGFMVSSPLLAMSGGDRLVVLSLGLAEEGLDRKAIEAILAAQEDAPPFLFRLSTEKGMLETSPLDAADKPAIRLVKGTAAKLTGRLSAVPWVLQIRVRFDVQALAVVPPAPGSGLPGRAPVLQVLLRDLGGAERPVKLYGVFRSLRLLGVQVQVDVRGLAEPLLRNDETLLDARKPFEPFGSSPSVGSRLVFAHPEICAKRLDSLQVGIDWLGAPANFATHYADYPMAGRTPITSNAVFTANLRLFDSRAAFPVKVVPLFQTTKDGSSSAVAESCWFGVNRGEIEAKYPGYGWTPPLPELKEPLDWARSWQLELADPDFQHAEYPQAAARMASKTDGGNPPKPTPVILNRPYTPKVKRLRLYYKASVELDPAAVGGSGIAEHQLHHAEPFGFAAPSAVPGAESLVHLFPQLDDDGQLYVGIEGLRPPQNLTLLLQMAPGSADPDLARGTVRWSVMDGSGWLSLNEGRVLSDTTQGLLNTGIVTLDLPPVREGTRLPSGKYWIRLAIDRSPRSVSDLVAVHTQAVCARAVALAGREDVHTTLAPETISGLVEARAEVGKVLQPYSSFGGSGHEVASAFYTRVGERLRHKNRAVTCWDYERLVLQAFPEIYKAKCLPVGYSEDPRESARVRLIVVPDIRNRRPFDPFEPKVPAETLRAIEVFLAARCPALARIQVRNPRYVALQLRFGVRFMPGRNPGFFLKALNEDLQRYLAPWAYDESADIVLGGRIHGNLLVHFIEQRPYVDYLAGMNLFVSEDGVNFRHVTQEELDGRQQGDTGAETILVSARHHFIDLITDELYEDESFVGINHMRIELDFRVAADARATRSIPNLKKPLRHATNPR